MNKDPNSEIKSLAERFVCLAARKWQIKHPELASLGESNRDKWIWIAGYLAGVLARRARVDPGLRLDLEDQERESREL